MSYTHFVLIILVVLLAVKTQSCLVFLPLLVEHVCIVEDDPLVLTYTPLQNSNFLNIVGLERIV